MRLKKKKRGFTLVELLIVIGISGVLMAMSAPKYQGIVGKANQMEQRAHVREALNYIDIYNLEASEDLGEDITLKSVTVKLTSNTDKAGFSEVLAKIDQPYKNKKISELRLFAEGKGSISVATVSQ